MSTPATITLHKHLAMDIKVGEVVLNYNQALNQFRSMRLTAIEYREDWPCDPCQHRFEYIHGEGHDIVTASGFNVYTIEN